MRALLRTDLAETRQFSKVRPARARDATRLLMVASIAPVDALRLVPLAEAARESGFDPQIAVLRAPGAPAHDPALSQLQASGLPVFTIDPPAGRGFFPALEQYRALMRIVRQVNPRIVHALGLRAVLVAGVIARRKRLAAVHSPDLVAQHLTRGPMTRWGRRMALGAGLAFAFGHRQAQVHVATPEDRAALIDAHVLDGRRSFLSRGIGVDLDAYHPRSAEAPAEDTVIVAFPPPDVLGREALATVIETARTLKEHGLPARFVLIGGQDQDRISRATQKVLQTWQNEGLIEWWELADNLAETLRRVDVFCVPVMPGRQASMTHLVAAAASGLTLIATDCAAFRDVIRHDLNGLLVPLGDGGALQAACVKAVRDRAFRQQAFHRSREIAMAEFGLEASITAALTMYQAALTPPARLRFFVRQPG